MNALLRALGHARPRPRGGPVPPISRRDDRATAGKQAGVQQGDTHLNRLPRIVRPENPGGRISLTEMIDAIEDVLGSAVPKLPVVEHRIDHRRRVAWLDAARVDTAQLKAQRIDDAGGVMNALRGDDVLLSVADPGSRMPGVAGG